MRRTAIMILLSILFAKAAHAKETCDKCCQARAHSALLHTIYLDHRAACNGNKNALHCAFVDAKRRDYEQAKAEADEACKK